MFNGIEREETLLLCIERGLSEVAMAVGGSVWGGRLLLFLARMALLGNGYCNNVSWPDDDAIQPLIGRGCLGLVMPSI